MLTPRPIIDRRALVAAAAWSLSRSLRAAAHRAAHRPLAAGSEFEAMTILVLRWQHPFAGTSRSRRLVRVIPVPASADSASRTSPQSRRRVQQHRPFRNHRRPSALSEGRRPPTRLDPHAAPASKTLHDSGRSPRWVAAEESTLKRTFNATSTSWAMGRYHWKKSSADSLGQYIPSRVDLVRH